jgi:HEAT repeat protein
MKKHWPEAALVLSALIAVIVAVTVTFRRPIPAEAKGPHGTLSAWLEELDSTDSEAARRAIRGMGTDAIPPLLEGVRRGEYVHAGTVAAIQLLGPRAIPVIIPALEDPNETVRLVTVHSLALFGRYLSPYADSLRPKLVALFDDPNSEVSIGAVLVVGRIGPSKLSVVPELTRVLSSEKGRSESGALLRQEVARVLGNIGPSARAAIPDLARLLKDSAPCTRRQAAIALWRISHEVDLVVPSLVKSLDEADSLERQRAAMTLLAIGREVSFDRELLERIYAVYPRAALRGRLEAKNVNRTCLDEDRLLKAEQ